jgi:hypothetical protein
MKHSLLRGLLVPGYTAHPDSYRDHPQPTLHSCAIAGLTLLLLYFAPMLVFSQNMSFRGSVVGKNTNNGRDMIFIIQNEMCFWHF